MDEVVLLIADRCDPTSTLEERCGAEAWQHFSEKVFTPAISRCLKETLCSKESNLLLDFLRHCPVENISKEFFPKFQAAHLDLLVSFKRWFDEAFFGLSLTTIDWRLLKAEDLGEDFCELRQKSLLADKKRKRKKSKMKLVDPVACSVEATAGPVSPDQSQEVVVTAPPEPEEEVCSTPQSSLRAAARSLAAAIRFDKFSHENLSCTRSISALQEVVPCQALGPHRLDRQVSWQILCGEDPKQTACHVRRSHGQRIWDPGGFVDHLQKSCRLSMMPPPLFF